MKKRASTLVVPLLRRTEVVEPGEQGSVSIDVVLDGQAHQYSVKPCRHLGEDDEEAAPIPLFYAVLDAEGVPWAEACLYLLGRAERASYPEVRTLAYLAQDLSEFRQFCDEEDIDWLKFPQLKMRRPTQRYKVFLELLIGSKEISRAIAERRINTVIAFYSDSLENGYFTLDNPPWEESRVNIFHTDTAGIIRVKSVAKKSASIARLSNGEPYKNGIEDEGKLRPLLPNERKALVESLNEIKNTELTLMHLLAISSGGRMQTIGTLRAKHFSRSPETINEYANIGCENGSGINTKKRKSRNLSISKPIYTRVYIYLKSDRYKARAKRAINGIGGEQYVFLTSHGNPFYDSREGLGQAVEQRGQRYKRIGQSLRQLIKEDVIPLMRKKLKDESFHYQFHDLRATFGVMFLESQPRDETGALKDATKVINDLRQLMWHETSVTTMRYVDYRPGESSISELNEKHSSSLDVLARIAMGH